MTKRVEFWGIGFAVSVIVAAVIACFSVELEDGKDWVARITALVGVAFTGSMFVVKLVERVQWVKCRLTDHDGDFAVVVHNTGAVPVNVSEVKLHVNDGIPIDLEPVNMGKSILAVQEAAVFFTRTSYSTDIPIRSCRVIVRSPSGVVTIYDGPELRSAVHGRGSRMFAILRKERKEEGRM